MSFSRELKRKRLKAKLSLRALEGRTGVSYSSLWRYEQGKYLAQMSVSHMAAISRFYGWELSDMGKKIAREAARNEKKDFR